MSVMRSDVAEAHWALDLTLAKDTTTRVVGLEVLDALSRSEYVGEHEFDVVDAAITPTLETHGNQIGNEYDEDRGAGTEGETDWTPSAGQAEGDE